MAGPSRPGRGPLPFALQGSEYEQLVDVRRPLTPQEEHLLLKQLIQTEKYGRYLDNKSVRDQTALDVPASRVFFLPEQRGGRYQWSASLSAQFPEKASGRAIQGPAGPMSALARLYFVTVLLKQDVPKTIPFQVRVPQTFRDASSYRELISRAELLGLVCLLYDLNLRTDKGVAEQILDGKATKITERIAEGIGAIDYLAFRVDLPLDAILRPPYRLEPLEEREQFAMVLEYRLSKKHFSQPDMLKAAKTLQQQELTAATGLTPERVSAQGPRTLSNFWGLSELHLVLDVDIEAVINFVARQQSVLRLGGQQQPPAPTTTSAPTSISSPGGPRTRAVTRQQAQQAQQAMQELEGLPIARLRRTDRIVSAVRVTPERSEEPEYDTHEGKCGTKNSASYVSDQVRIGGTQDVIGDPWSPFREAAVKGDYYFHLPHELFAHSVSETNRGYPVSVWHNEALSIAGMTVVIGLKRAVAQRERLGPLCRRLTGPMVRTRSEALRVHSSCGFFICDACISFC
jgi:hypothetical protein